MWRAGSSDRCCSSLRGNRCYKTYKRYSKGLHYHVACSVGIEVSTSAQFLNSTLLRILATVYLDLVTSIYSNQQRSHSLSNDHLDVSQNFLGMKNSHMSCASILPITYHALICTYRDRIYPRPDRSNDIQSSLDKLT